MDFSPSCFIAKNVLNNSLQLAILTISNTKKHSTNSLVVTLKMHVKQCQMWWNGNQWSNCGISKKKKFLWKKCIFALLLLASKILPKNISFYNMQYTILPIIINKDLLISLKYNSVFFLWLILLLAKNYKPRLLRFFRITQFFDGPPTGSSTNLGVNKIFR